MISLPVSFPRGWRGTIIMPSRGLGRKEVVVWYRCYGSLGHMPRQDVVNHFLFNGIGLHSHVSSRNRCGTDVRMGQKAVPPAQLLLQNRLMLPQSKTIVI